MRQPWVPPASPSFLRSWLICGRFPNPPKSAGEDTLTTLRTGIDTDFLKNYSDEGAARPADGERESLATGSQLTWTAYTSPTDAVDLAQVFTDRQSNNCVAYAYTTITSPGANDMLMTVGSDDAVRVWLNGKLVHTNVAARGVSPDNDIVPVRLNQGANTVLVKVVNAGAGWGFALRFAHPADLSKAIFRPWVSPETADHKIVVTTGLGKVDAVPVDIAIVEADGKIVGRERSTLGVPVTFNAASWPAGAYEARCIPSFPDGDQPVVHVGFYHGDALAVARRLVSTAPANGESEAELNHAMLADMVRSKIGDPAKDTSLTNDQVNSIVSPLMEWEEIQSKSQIRPYGFVRFAYRDPIDDSPQFCRAYLPPGYTPDKKWPMVVILHGANFDNPSYVGWAGNWGIDARHNNAADIYHVIELEPMGRYNSFYRGMAEQDILRCITMAKDRFSVDDDRVYLGGISMGGAGTWGIGSRHPEIFAAISPNLGVFDYHVNTPASEVATLSPRDLFFREAQSTLVQVESLLTTPIFVNHGDADPVIDVNQSRYAIRMLQRWGYDVRYWEHPGGGHGDFNTDPEVYPWFLRHTRVSNPRKVRLRAADIKTASAHWVRVLAYADPYQMMVAEAEVVGPNHINLSTTNALAVALSPKAPLIDPSKPIAVTWNGVDQPPAMLDGRGVLTFHAADYQAADRDKNATIAGPLNDITNTPFAIVVGTQSNDPAVNAFCRQSADDIVARWQKAQHCSPRVFIDTQVTDEDIARYSLYLIGGADANVVTARLAKQLPLQIDKSSITIAGRTFDAPDAAYQAIFPNPHNAERYVRICGATSATALTKLWSIPEDAYDFGIVDARTGEPIAAGVFDAHWRCTDAGTLLGKDAVRTNPRGPRAP
jgi:dienelactone hydrolase